MRLFRRRRRTSNGFPVIQVLGRGKPDDGSGGMRTIAVAGLAVAAIGSAAGVVAVLPHGEKASSATVKTASGAPASALTIEEAVVHNTQAQYTSVGDDTPEDVGRQTPSSSPSIDVTVLNNGRRRVLVTGARFEILDWAELPICYTQGGGPVPLGARYTIPIPADPPTRSQRTFERALHRQVPAGDVDRFLFRFAPASRTLDVQQLVILRLKLQISGGGTLDAGKFLISLPDTLDGSRFPVVDDLTRDERDGWLGLAPTWCFEQNLVAARRILASDARRSQEMQAVGPFTPAPSWVRDHDRTPARAAASKLVDQGYAPPDFRLAIYAAQQTGDPAFVARITDAAAQRMLEAAKKSLDLGEPQAAAENARASLAARDTPEGRAVLMQAQSREKQRPASRG